MQVYFLLFRCGMWYVVNMKQEPDDCLILTVFINQVFLSMYKVDLWIYLQGFTSYPFLHINVLILNNIWWFNKFNINVATLHKLSKEGFQ